MVSLPIMHLPKSNFLYFDNEHLGKPPAPNILNLIGGAFSGENNTGLTCTDSSVGLKVKETIAI